MIVLNILGYFGQNKQNSYAALNVPLLYPPLCRKMCVDASIFINFFK